MSEVPFLLRAVASTTALGHKSAKMKNTSEKEFFSKK
jgi:hypothetical protein